MTKKNYGVRLEEKYAKIYDDLHTRLGGNKYRIIEASLEIFTELPKSLQSCLVSYDEEERQLILQELRAIKTNPKGKKHG